MGLTLELTPLYGVRLRQRGVATKIAQRCRDLVYPLPPLPLPGRDGGFFTRKRRKKGREVVSRRKVFFHSVSLQPSSEGGKKHLSVSLSVGRFTLCSPKILDWCGASAEPERGAIEPVSAPGPIRCLTCEAGRPRPGRPCKTSRTGPVPTEALPKGRCRRVTPWGAGSSKLFEVSKSFRISVSP